MYFTNKYNEIDTEIYDITFDAIFSKHNVPQNDEPSNYLIADFLFSGEDITSSVQWAHAVNDDVICDEIHSQSIFAQNDSFSLQTVSGDTYCYEMSGATLNGGFYQGYYKLEGYNYQTLPERYLQGASFEFTLNKKDLLNQCPEKLRLNDAFPDNYGFFFYIGLKSESPWCGKDISGSTCEDVPFMSEFDDATIYPWNETNSFLYYNQNNLCNQQIDEIREMKDCCEGLLCNALGVRVLEDGRIGLRYIGQQGDCETGYETMLFDVQSNVSFIENDKEYKIILKFENLEYNDECDKYKSAGRMKFSFWANGYNVFQHIVPEIFPYALDLHRSLQIGIPYNISVGGGTLGNLENTLEDYVCPDVLYSHSFCFQTSGDTFTGYETFSGDIITFNEAVDIEGFIEKIEDVFIGQSKISIVNRKGCHVVSGDFEHNEQIKHLFIGDMKINTKLEKTIEIICKENCSTLAENFAGTFIGDIKDFKIYDKALTVQQIRALSDDYLNQVCC